MAMFAGASFFPTLLLIVLVICWVILRFAIIGTKPLLRQLIAETKRTSELLEHRLPALRGPW